jgi:hypothetical protein
VLYELVYKVSIVWGFTLSSCEFQIYLTNPFFKFDFKKDDYSSSSTDKLHMTMYLQYGSENRQFMNEDLEFDTDNLTPQQEDYDKAREIGVLTPRSVVSQDTDSEESLKNIYEIEFLQMMDEQEDHLEILDSFTHEPHWRQPEVDIPDMFTSQVVRITHVKSTYSLGSLGDNQPTSVYIPHTICGYDVPSRWLHDFYFMDLKFHPQGRNKYCAQVVHPKLDTDAMLESVTEVFCRDKPYTRRADEEIDHLVLHSNYVFNVPIEHGVIGIIIGKEGKNLKNLTDKFHMGSEPPDITITPTVPGMAEVTVACHTFSEWLPSDIINLVSHMHA